MRRKMRTYNQMVQPDDQYEDDHAIDGASVPIVQQRGARWPLLVALVLLLAVVTVVYINRGTIAAPSIMAYSEQADAYQTDAPTIRQRGMAFTKTSMNCDDLRMEPLGTVGGVWHVDCIQERK